MTQPSDRARKAAAELLASGLWHYPRPELRCAERFATFERETPGFAAGAMAEELNAVANRVRNMVSREDWRTIVRCAAAIRNLTPAPPASEVKANSGGLDGAAFQATLAELLYEHDPMCGHEDCRYTARMIAPLILAALTNAKHLTGER